MNRRYVLYHMNIHKIWILSKDRRSQMMLHPLHIQCLSWQIHLSSDAINRVWQLSSGWPGLHISFGLLRVLKQAGLFIDWNILWFGYCMSDSSLEQGDPGVWNEHFHVLCDYVKTFLYIFFWKTTFAIEDGLLPFDFVSTNQNERFS